jgi:hypothetical protein
MADLRTLPALALAGLCLAGPVVQAAADDAVTVYRCTSAAGHLTLRDTPCAKGEKQEARSMARPKDAPPPPPQPVREASTQREPVYQEHYATPPRISYECVTVDGERYTSDSGVGRMRFEPNYLPYSVLAFPGGGHHGRGGSGVSAAVGYRGSHVNADVQVGGPSRPYPRPDIVPVVPVGEWVRDTCYALPQAEACDRLRDDRSELNRRWHIAQPTERAQIDLETRSLDARLDNDCGGR